MFAMQRKHATKLLGVRCRIVVGLFVEPKLMLGESGYYLENDYGYTCILFDPDGAELAQGDFYEMLRVAKRLIARDRDEPSGIEPESPQQDGRTP